MKKFWPAISIIFTISLFSSISYGLSFNLDVNNIGLSGGPWATVEITQVNEYKVHFTVDPIDSAFNKLSNFGLQSFGFNESTTNGGGLVIALPSGWLWKDKDKDKEGGFGPYGKFDIAIDTTGSNRQNPLEFDVSAEFPILVEQFTTELSTKGFLFAAHIADFSTGLSEGKPITSGMFSTTGTPAQVPEPTTVLLLGCGLVGLAVYGRKRSFKK